VTSTFDLFTSKPTKLIFVPNRTLVVNSAKFPRMICTTSHSQTFSIWSRKHGWTHRQPEYRMPPVDNSRQRHNDNVMGHYKFSSAENCYNLSVANAKACEHVLAENSHGYKITQLWHYLVNASVIIRLHIWQTVICSSTCYTVK